MIRSEFCKKYGIPYETYAADYADEYEGADDNFAEVIVDWLEQEHPTKKYIELENVIDAITKAQEKFKGATVVKAYGEEIIRRLEQCETRELEE